MALPLVPMSELDAVNAMLMFIGELPVNSLEVSGVTDATIAQKILHNTSRSIQAKGLHCNTEYQYQLSPDNDGIITVPANVLKIDPSDRTLDYTQRGSRLYDLTNHTYVFTKAVKLDIVFFLNFVDLSQPAKDWITIMAAKAFSKRVLGSELLEGLTQDELFEARSSFKKAEMDAGDHSIFDSYSVARIINRRHNPIGRK